MIVNQFFISAKMSYLWEACFSNWEGDRAINAHNSLHMLHYVSVVHRFSAGILTTSNLSSLYFDNKNTERNWTEQEEKCSSNWDKTKIKAVFPDYHWVDFVCLGSAWT